MSVYVFRGPLLPKDLDIIIDGYLLHNGSYFMIAVFSYAQHVQ